MLTSKKIKDAAFSAGADLCGIGPMSRFEGAPEEMDPRYLFPEAKSCIAFAFRIPRGVQRGIEEGTQFYQYPSMAYGGINEIFAPSVMYHVGKLIEDAGYEAFVYRNTGARGSVSDMNGAQGNTISLKNKLTTMNMTRTRLHTIVPYSLPALRGLRIPHPTCSFISVWQL